MAISRSLMNRQLQADGGIMQVAPREKFGLGSKLKRFVRKIIPNEVADIAVKAAPFVAPFNPAVAAAMAGLGSFDQTGKIGSSLKRGALTYGGGQAARYLGGADFQGNPFDPGGAFTGSGFKGGFSSPLGSETGLGKFFSNRGTEGVQAIDSSKPLRKPLNLQPGDGSIDLATGGSDGFGIIQDTVTDTVTNTPGSAMDSFKSIVSFDTSAGQKTDAAFDLLKRGSKALFYDSEGKLDRAAVIGAVTAAASYAEALALANNAGVELTEEEYNEARKDEKKAEYAGYLQNFFGGKKDGGRIGFESGANEMIKTQLLEEIMPETTTEDFVMIMTEDGPKMVLRSKLPSESMMMDTTTSVFGDAGRGREVPQEFRADGGRIGFKRGSPEETSEIGIMSIDVEAGDDDDEEDMMMAYSDAIFNRREKAALFRALGDPRIQQTTGSFKDLNNLLKNPGMFPEREFILKEYLKIKGYADGGRIGFAFGSPDRKTDIEEELSVDTIYRPTDKPPMLEEMPGGDKMVDIDYTPSFIKDFDKNLDKLSFSKFNKPYLELEILEKEFIMEVMKNIGNTVFKADGGRIGYKGGANRVSELLILRDEKVGKGEDVSDIEAEIFQLTGKTFRSVGGISDVPTGKMRKNNAGVVERDYRDEGGFVPVGIKERADDVPAMLSKNEFVMTADAVRGIGNGSVEEGSKKLYNTMKKAEQVGKA